MGLIPSPRNSEANSPTIADLIETARDRLRAVASLSTAAMLMASWPLWIDGGEIPRVPFLNAYPSLAPVVSWSVFFSTIAATVLTGLTRRWRPWLLLGIALLIVMVLGDQHRFQPWAYQFAVTAVLLATWRGDRGLTYVRIWFVALYVHSGLSKLDRSFRDELGPVFLETGLRQLGLGLATIPETIRASASLLMPLGEILVGALLAFERSRRIGRLMAVVLHVALLLILGPFGLGHGALVLVWNAAILVEVLVAFGPRVVSSRLTWIKALRTFPLAAAFWVLVLLPFGERWGYFDAWPSHALYASHVGRVSVRLHTRDSENWPERVRRHTHPVDGDDSYVVLDLNAWSRELRGTPVYPQTRACLGLAEGLAARYGDGLLTRVVLFGPADLWGGKRSREEIDGLSSIRRRGDHFLLNAHPATPPP